MPRSELRTKLDKSVQEETPLFSGKPVFWKHLYPHSKGKRKREKKEHLWWHDYVATDNGSLTKSVLFDHYITNAEKRQRVHSIIVPSIETIAYRDTVEDMENKTKLAGM